MTSLSNPNDYQPLVFALQPDGRILIGGVFLGVNGIPRGPLARLNADGSVDETFHDPGIAGSVTALALQADGSILAAGTLTVGTNSPRSFVRLRTDGTLDSGFNPSLPWPSPYSLSHFCIAAQTDGRILLGFSAGPSTRVPFDVITRLLPGGTTDASFKPNWLDDPGPNGVTALALQTNGQILISGAKAGIGRLNGDAAPAIVSGPASQEIVAGVPVSFSVIATGPGLIFYQWQKNAKNLVGETNAILSLTNVQESDVGDYTVLVSNATGAVLSEPAHLTLPAQVGPGSLDLSFNPAPPPVRGIYGYDYSIGLSLLQADGNIIVSGGYDNGMKVWQLNSHGGFVKTVFDNLDGSVNALANLLDGRVLLSYKQFYHGMNPIFGFDPDGTNFTVFSPAYSISGSGGGISGDVQCMAVQTDGKVLVGGSFFIRPLNKVGLMRFNPDGSMDNLKDILVPSVPPQGAGPAPCVPVNRLAALPDNRILFSTSYADANWVPRAMLARTHTDGSLDDSFNVVTNGGINLLAVDAAQRILVAGDFTQILGVPRNHIARLLPDGQLDTNFDPGSGPDDTISCLAVQLNGKIWVGGGFTNWNGFPSHCIAKLNSDGSRDGSFDPGTGAGNPGNRAVVTSVALEANGDLLIGGIFSSFNDIPRAYLARLHGDPAPPLLRLSEGRWSNGEFSFRLQGPNGGRYALQTSTNLVDWQGWTNVQMSGSSLVLTNIVSTTNTTPRFYRAAAE